MSVCIQAHGWFGLHVHFYIQIAVPVGVFVRRTSRMHEHRYAHVGLNVCVCRRVIKLNRQSAAMP